MMRKTVFFPVMVVLFLCFAIAAAGQKHDHVHGSAIELNNGHKWKVDDGMMVHIRSMDRKIAAFSGSTLTEYKSLGRDLQQDIDLLTAGCTMKGRAHDELHKWLLPFIDTVSQLSKAKNTRQAAASWQQAKTSMKDFYNYFE